MLRAALAWPGITCGSHAWSHPNLAALTPDEAREELARSRRWLDDEAGSTVPWVAYPYGLASPVVHEIAESLGLQGGLLIEGGFMAGSSKPTMTMPRLNVPAGVTREGFMLRTAGLLR
jgi:peptidoglycan/xylan/chitin deacetylase (PgdA/CDA1 family)